MTYADRVLAMYEAYCPAKLYKVPSLLKQYIGRERELLDALITKYGDEPGRAQVAGPMPTDAVASQFQRRKVQYVVDMYRAQRCEMQCRLRDLETQISRQEHINALQDAELIVVRDGVATAGDYNNVTSAQLEAKAQALTGRIAALRAQVFDLHVSTGINPASLSTVEEYIYTMNRTHTLQQERDALKEDVRRMAGVVDMYLKMCPDAVMRSFLRKVRPTLECRLGNS